MSKSSTITCRAKERERMSPLADLFARVTKLFREKQQSGALVWPPSREALPNLPMPAARMVVRTDVLWCH